MDIKSGKNFAGIYLLILTLSLFYYKNVYLKS